MKLKTALLVCACPLFLLTGCHNTTPVSSLPEASSTETPKFYTVSFLNADRALLQKVDVKAGETAAYTGEDPTLPSDIGHTYVWTGWDKQLGNVQSNFATLATYESRVRMYTVSFYQEDGTTLIGSVQTAYGAAAVAPVAPEKAATDEASYAFSGWDKDISKISGDLSVKAVYKATAKTYTVTFLSEDGSTTLGTDTVEYGKAATYHGDTPTKASSAQYSYAFHGWDQPIDKVTSALSVKALFEKTEREYSVTFHNGDDSIFGAVQQVKYGAAASLPAANPTKASTERKEYRFKAWKQDVSLITGDLDVYPDFYEDNRYYTVSFIVEGVKVGERSLQYGEDAVYDETAWGAPAKASTDELTYAFSGWDHTLTSVASSFEAHAVFASNERQYDVTFHYDGDDASKTYVAKVGYGKPAVYTSEEAYAPFKAPTRALQYAFSEWTGGDLTSITSDVEVSASFTSSDRRYEARFHTGGENDAIIADESVTYGTKLSAPYGYVPVADSGNASKLFKVWLSEGGKTSAAEKSSISCYNLYENGDVSAHDSVVDFYPTYTDSTYTITYEKVTPAGEEPYVQVTGFSGDLGSFPEIKSTYDGVAVTTIKSGAFFQANSLYDIAIPSSITSIGASAFINCNNLRSVSLPSTLTTIDDMAFQNTYSLQSVRLPKSLTLLGSYAFAYSGIASLSYEEEATMDFAIGSNAFLQCNSLTSAIFLTPTLASGSDIFRECTALKTLTIKGQGTKLPISFCDGCSALESVSFENSAITTLENFSFFGCSALKSISLPSSVQSIGALAFNRCSALTEFEIPKSCATIAVATSATIGKCNVFGGDRGLAAFKVASGNTAFVVGEDGALYSADKTRLVAYPAGRLGEGFSLPEGVTSIDYGAFEGAATLKVLTLPSTLTSLSTGALACSPITTLLLTRPDQLTTLETDCCRFSQLLSYSIPSSVTSLGNHAFMESSTLTSVVIPSTITALPVQSFASCSALTSVSIEGNALTSIGSSCFAGDSKLTSISLPSSVTTIGESAFENCAALSSCAIPSSVTSIGDKAFRQTGLTSVSIPASCLSIGKLAFVNDFSKMVTTSISLAEGVTSIGESAFALTAITSIILPASLENVGTTLFFNCASLTSIYLADTELNSAWSSTWNGGNGKTYSYYLYSATSNTDGAHWHYLADGVTPEVWHV